MTVAAAASAANSFGFNQQKNNKNNDISSVTPGAFSFVPVRHVWGHILALRKTGKKTKKQLEVTRTALTSTT